MNMFVHSNKELAPLGKFLFTLDAVNGRKEGRPSGYFPHMPDSLDVLEHMRTLEKLNRDFRCGPGDPSWRGSDYEGINDYVHRNWDRIDDIPPYQAVRELEMIRVQFSDFFSTGIIPRLIQYTARFYYPKDILEIEGREGAYNGGQYETVRNLVTKCFMDRPPAAALEAADIPDMKPFIKPDFHSLVTTTSPEMFKNNIRILCETPYYKKDPLLACKELLRHTAETDIAALRTLFKDYGLTDEESTKKTLSQWGREAAGHSSQKNGHSEAISQSL
jgi:hypothetical protein